MINQKKSLMFNSRGSKPIITGCIQLLFGLIRYSERASRRRRIVRCFSVSACVTRWWPLPQCNALAGALAMKCAQLVPSPPSLWVFADVRQRYVSALWWMTTHKAELNRLCCLLASTRIQHKLLNGWTAQPLHKLKLHSVNFMQTKKKRKNRHKSKNPKHKTDDQTVSNVIISWWNDSAGLGWFRGNAAMLRLRRHACNGVGDLLRLKTIRPQIGLCTTSLTSLFVFLLILPLDLLSEINDWIGYKLQKSISIRRAQASAKAAFNSPACFFSDCCRTKDEERLTLPIKKKSRIRIRTGLPPIFFGLLWRFVCHLFCRILWNWLVLRRNPANKQTNADEIITSFAEVIEDVNLDAVQENNSW